MSTLPRFSPRIHSFALGLLLAITPLWSNAFAASEHFRFKTLDGKADLRGQIDLPDTQGKLPVVVMMPGTGLFDRNVYFGHSKTKKDLLFKQLSKVLQQKGVATLRYDYRGVSCSNQSSSPDENCVDNAIRATVTPQNMRSDFEQIYHWGEKHERIDPQQMIVFAHSEGSVHTAHLLAERRIQPRAVVLMGGLYESPQSVVQWQLVGRFHDHIMKADGNKDEKVTVEEISAYQALDPLLAMMPLAMLLPPEELKAWTSPQLSQRLTAQHQAITQVTLAENDHLPYPSESDVHASMAWWKMFFKDTHNTAPLFAQGNIPVINHLGDADSQVSITRQQTVLDQLKTKHQLSIQSHPGTGHSLGAHPLFGPMNPESEKRLVESILKQLKP